MASPVRLLLALAMITVSGASSAQSLVSLAELRWSHRVILMDTTDPRLLGQLRDNQAAIDDRDLIWIAVDNEEMQSNLGAGISPALRAELNRDYFGRFDETVFLIGKDGTLKSRDAKLDLEALFGRIDAMPMRRREMRESATP